MNAIKKLTIPVLIAALFSLTACGGGGGSSTPTNTDPDPDPDPTPTGLPSVTDSSWNSVNRTPVINKAVFTGTEYIAVGDSGYIAKSADGTNWTALNLDSVVDFHELIVAPNGTNAMALSNSNQGFMGYAVTTDGTNWQIYGESLNTNCVNIISVTHDGTQFVAVSNGNKICTSTDGISWALQSTQAIGFNDVAYGAGKYLFSLVDGLVSMTALDSTAMEVATFPTAGDGDLVDILYGESVFVGLSRGEKLLYSADGVSWSATTGPATFSSIVSLTYSADKGFTAYSRNYTGQIFTSSDGMNWTLVDGASLPVGFQDVYQYANILTNGSSKTLAFKDDGTVYESTDFISWTQATPVQPTGKVISYLNQGGKLYAATGTPEEGTQLYSSADNGAVWSRDPDISVGVIADIIHDGSQFIAAGDLGMAYSVDGSNWTRAFSFQASLRVSAELNSTTYYFASANQLLTSDDGISFAVDSALATAVANSAGGIIGDIQQAVSDGSVLVARTTQSIVAFDGSTWTVAVSDTTTMLNDIAVMGNLFVIVGNSGNVMTSTDGINWTTQTWLNGGGVNIYDVVAVDTTLYATDGASVASSSDSGVNWTLAKDFSTSSNAIVHLAYDDTNSTIYGFGNSTLSGNPILTTSTDGALWSTSSSLGRVTAHVFYDSVNERFVDYTGRESTNGSNWTATTQYPADASFSYFNVSNDLSVTARYGLINFVSGTPDTYISGRSYSEDGQNWVFKTDQIPYQGYTPVSGVYANGVGITSTDGINFAEVAVTGMFNNAAGSIGIPLGYANNQYVVVQGHGSGVRGVYTSSNASDWTLQIELSGDSFSQWNGNITDIEYDGTQYIILYNDASEGVMLITSSDLQNFIVHKTGVKFNASDLTLNSAGYVITGDEGGVATHAAY